MKYGLKDEYIEKIKQVFASFPGVEKAIIYGSRAKGNYHGASDIDITLVGSNLDISDLFKIENHIDDLMMPYKTDISIYHKITNNEVAEHINRIGKVFYKKE
jgi:predicted nucleotidyltransferase